MTRFRLVALTILLSLLVQQPLHAQVSGVGAMGDSLSDEYLEDDYDYAYNWVEQLVIYRDADFGPTAAEAGQPGGTWGEPRRAGYQYNWARSGADSGSLLTDGQHTGLAALVGPDGVTHAFLMIGANDFFPMPLPGYAYFQIYHGYWTQDQIDQYVADILANIETALTTITDAGGELILGNVVDYSVAPEVWQSFFWQNPDKRQRVTDVIVQLNLGVRDLAQTHELMLVDFFGFASAVFGTNYDLHEFLILGDVPIELWEKDTTTHDHPEAGFVHDGVHPHTHLQGIMANLFTTALNCGYDAGIPTFTEEEILSHAGMIYGGTDTLAGQIGQYEDYVWNFSGSHPFQDLDADGDVDLRDFVRFQACFEPGGPPLLPGCTCADFDGDEDVDLTDFAEFYAALTATP
jgi:lysophospholipase L1-like esterase